MHFDNEGNKDSHYQLLVTRNNVLSLCLIFSLAIHANEQYLGVNYKALG